MQPYLPSIITVGILFCAAVFALGGPTALHVDAILDMFRRQFRLVFSGTKRPH